MQKVRPPSRELSPITAFWKELGRFPVAYRVPGETPHCGDQRSRPQSTSIARYPLQEDSRSVRVN
jgi:hypothetical protein